MSVTRHRGSGSGGRRLKRRMGTPKARWPSWPLAPSASSSATSARRRSTPSAKPSPDTTRSGSGPAAHLRRPQPDLLVDDDHRDPEVRHDHHARRQQGRGRQPRAARADQSPDRRQEEMDQRDRPSRRFRDRAVLRRFDDHAGDLGPLGGRGADDRQCRFEPMGHTDCGRHPGRPVRDPVARDGARRPAVRPGHAHLFHDHRGARRDPHSSVSRR